MADSFFFEIQKNCKSVFNPLLCFIVFYNHVKNKILLEPFFRKVEKNPVFQHLIPYNPRLRIFSEKLPCEFGDILMNYLYAKNQENP